MLKQTKNKDKSGKSVISIKSISREAKIRNRQEKLKSKETKRNGKVVKLTSLLGESIEERNYKM